MDKTKWPTFRVDSRLFFFKENNNQITLNTVTLKANCSSKCTSSNQACHRENKFATEDTSRKWTTLEQKNRGGAEMVARIISGPPLWSMHMLQSMKELKCQVYCDVND